MGTVEEFPPEFLSALSKLHWASGGEWSANLKPAECRAILHQLGVKSTITKAFARDEVSSPSTREEVVPYIGDPGDEHHET